MHALQVVAVPATVWAAVYVLAAHAVQEGVVADPDAPKFSLHRQNAIAVDPAGAEEPSGQAVHTVLSYSPP